MTNENHDKIDPIELDLRLKNFLNLTREELNTLWEDIKKYLESQR